MLTHCSDYTMKLIGNVQYVVTRLTNVSLRPESLNAISDRFFNFFKQSALNVLHAQHGHLSPIAENVSALSFTYQIYLHPET